MTPLMLAKGAWMTVTGLKAHHARNILCHKALLYIRAIIVRLCAQETMRAGVTLLRKT